MFMTSYPALSNIFFMVFLLFLTQKDLSGLVEGAGYPFETYFFHRGPNFCIQLEHLSMSNSKGNCSSSNLNPSLLYSSLGIQPPEDIYVFDKKEDAQARKLIKIMTELLTVSRPTLGRNSLPPTAILAATIPFHSVTMLTLITTRLIL